MISTLIQGMQYEFAVLGCPGLVDDFKNTDTGILKGEWIYGKRFTVKATSTQVRLVTDLIFDKNGIDWVSTWYFLNKKINTEINNIDLLLTSYNKSDL